MQFDTSVSPEELKKPAIEIEGGLTYNPDQVTIEGLYSDELSQYRAKKTWCTILETDFLLIPDADFQFQLKHNQESNQYGIACSFTSACGRYAFWRLINEQVPEVQFLLETAHISHRYRDISSLIEGMESPAPAKEKPLLKSLGKGVEDAIEQIKRLARRVTLRG